MSVFLSWRGQDREIKNELAGALRKELGENETIWDSDEYCVDNFSEECIDAIEKCEVFILLLTDAAMEPSYVINEVTKARELYNAGKLNIVIYKITPHEMKKDLQFQLNHISFITPALGGIKAVAARTRLLLEKRRLGVPEKPNDTDRPVVSGVPVGRNTGFMPGSRDVELCEIDEAFERSNVIFVGGLCGFGRTSLVREYLRLHGESFGSSVYVNDFSGSLRDFFLYGLNFSNVNPAAFSDMTEHDLLLRKAELLGRLPEDSLIVVSGVTVGKNDDGSLFDVLDSLRCRVVFIVQTLPGAIAGRYPCVSVGSMKNEYLRELFFGYFPELDGQDRINAEAAFDRFAAKIGGHTKSVEIAAKILSDDDFAELEDIVAFLDGIKVDNTAELKDKIVDAMSSMFEMNRFSDAEMRVLYVASLVASPPMPRRTFASYLKECGCYDKDVFRSLLEKGWLEKDEVCDTVTVNPAVAAVCTEKIGSDRHILAVCLRESYDSFANDLSENFVKKIGTEDRILGRCMISAGFKNMGGLCEMVYKVASGQLTMTDSHHADMLANAEAELSEIGSCGAADELTEIVTEIGEYILPIWRNAFSIWDIGNVLTENEKNDRYMEFMTENYISVIGDFFDLGKNDVPESGFDSEVTALAGKAFNSLTESRSYGAKLMAIVKFAFDVLDMADDEPEEDEDAEVVEMMFAMLLNFLSQVTLYLKDINPLGALALCRLKQRMEEKCCYSMSAADTLQTLDIKFGIMDRMAEYSDEYKDTFERAADIIRTKRGEIFDSEKNYTEHYMELICSFCISAVKNDDIEKALEAAGKADGLSAFNDDSAERAVELASTLFSACVREGLSEEAVSLTRKSWVTAAGNHVLRNVGERAFEASAEEYKWLLETAASVESRDTDNGFGDGAEEHMDYYEKYASELHDRRAYKKYEAIAAQARETDLSGMTHDEVLGLAGELRMKAARGISWEKLAGQAFALVSEAGFRTLGYRHHFVQFVGAAAMADGKISEMRNGEGKTYTIVLTAFLRSLYGDQVHIMDDSAYLSKRNFRWMAPVYEYLGCSVVSMENGRHVLAEDHDVVYGTTSDFLFGVYRFYLNDNDPGHIRKDFAIVDEADKSLILQGNVPFDLCAPSTKGSAELCEKAFRLVSGILPEEENDYFFVENGNITLKQKIYELWYEQFTTILATSDISGMKENEDALIRAIRVCRLYKRNEDYHILAGDVPVFENTVTGRFDRFDGIYTYLIRRKEGLDTGRTIEKKNIILRSTFYCFIRLYREFAGTTATASSMAEEFASLYGKDVFSVPTNAPVIRVDHPPRVFLGVAEKQSHLISFVEEKQAFGQPVLIVTERMENALALHAALRGRGLECSVLSAGNENKEREIFGRAGVSGSVTIATMLANRGIDIKLGGDPAFMAEKDFIGICGSAEKAQALISTAVMIEELSEEDAALCQKYLSLLAYYQCIANKEKEKVVSLGGLCVVGTDCFDDVHTEVQMRGRAGRQGQPGESHVFYSMEDRSLKMLTGEKADALRKIFSRTEETLDELGDFNMPMLNKAIAYSRKRIQRAKYGGIGKQTDVLFYDEPRRRFLGILEELRSGSLLPEDFILRYYCSDPGVIRKAVRREDKKDALLSDFILPRVRGELSELRRKNTAKLLLNAYIACVNAKTPDYFSAKRDELLRLIKDECVRAFLRFFREMEKLEKTKALDRNNEKKTKEAVDTLVSGILFDAAETSMQWFLLDCGVWHIYTDEK